MSNLKSAQDLLSRLYPGATITMVEPQKLPVLYGDFLWIADTKMDNIIYHDENQREYEWSVFKRGSIKSIIRLCVRFKNLGIVPDTIIILSRYVGHDLVIKFV